MSVFMIDYTAANESDVIKTSVDNYLPSPNHYGQVYTVNAGPSGFVVSTSWDTENLKLWKVSSNGLELLQSESIRQPGIFITPDLKLTASDISPNGQHVVTAGSKPFDIIMFALNGTKLENKTRTNSNLSHEAQITGIKFTNDSTHLVSAGLDGNIILWEVAQKKDLSAICNNTVHRPGFANMHLSRSNEFVIATHLKNDVTGIANISIWNIDYTKKKITLVNETRNSEAHNSDILGIAVSPDEKYLASMGANSILKFWRLENYTMVDQLMAYPLGQLATLMFTLDGQFLVAALPNYNLLFRYGPSGLILESNSTKSFNPTDTYSMTQDPLSKLIIMGDADGSLKLYKQS